LAYKILVEQIVKCQPSCWLKNSPTIKMNSRENTELSNRCLTVIEALLLGGEMVVSVLINTYILTDTDNNYVHYATLIISDRKQ